MHEETGWLNVKLFADVLADLSEIIAALAAGAGFGFMAMFDTRQMIGQGLTTSTRTRCVRYRFGYCRGVRLPLSQFGFGRRQITGQGFLKQITLLSRQGFGAYTKAHPAQVRQFKRECLDFGLGSAEFGVAQRDLPTRFDAVFLGLIDECLNGVRDPIREGEIGVKTRQFSG